MTKSIDKEKTSAMPSLALAYLGDSVYELLVRRYLITKGSLKVKGLHKAAIKFVQAKSQAKILHALEDLLTEEEQAVVRRGRNAKSGTTPKNVNVIDYRYSTAFEALIGYLFLLGEEERIETIFDVARELIEQE